MNARRLLCFVLACLMLFTAAVPTRAVNQQEADGLILQILTYYMNYQTQAETDILHLLSRLESLDPAQAELWKDILRCWYDTYHGGSTVCTDILPDGLPQDNSLCIVVLGFALNADGSIKPELQGRLETALRSAEKYPNAYIACSGGMAYGSEQLSEAETMARWLIRQGIDPNRIITENRSTSTTENAQYTYQLLAQSYPGIRSVAIVTSDYHVLRSCLMWDVMSLYSAANGQGPAIPVVGAAAFPSGNSGDEGLHRQAWGIAIIAGINFHNLPAVSLSRLQSLTVSGDTHYPTGSALSLTVTAHYDTGVTRDVTAMAAFSGFAPGTEGTQTVSVSYTENSITATQSIEIRVGEESLTETQTPTEPPEESPSQLPETFSFRLAKSRRKPLKKA